APARARARRRPQRTHLPGEDGPRMTPRHFGLARPLLAGLAVLVAFLAAAPAEAGPRPFQTGTHVLRRILFDQGCHPLAEVGDLARDTAQTVLVVIGDPGVALDRWRAGWLLTFVENGGAVLFASDQRVSSEKLDLELRGLAGVKIAAFKLEADPR